MEAVPHQQKSLLAFVLFDLIKGGKRLSEPFAMGRVASGATQLLVAGANMKRHFSG